MVKTGWWIGLYFCLIFAGLNADQVTVEANINQNIGQVNSPLNGTVTITYDRGLEVDLKSFVWENKPFDATFVKNVSVSATTVISIYSFTLPSESKGEHILTPISVKVGGKVYKSTPTSYEVRDEIPSSKRPTAKSNKPPILRLEAVVKGPSTLYLGERTKLVYRIFFNQSIDLTKSDLPFVHAKSFRKVGDAQISDAQEGDFTIQEITQEIEASQLGSFKIGPSMIEGHAENDPKVLRADAPAVEIVVQPFPPGKQPDSFTGALGVVKAEAALSTPAKVGVGDSIDLKVTVSGITNLADSRLPVLLCQPGFSGFFQINDLPPAAEVKGEAKIFHVELRALTPFAKEIPSIELSSFDLDTKSFHVIHTKPIPLTVLQVAPKAEGEAKEMAQTPTTKKDLMAMLQRPAPPLQSRGIVVDQSQVPFFQRGWILLAIPFGLGLLLLQMRWRREWENRPKPLVRTSDELLKQAKKAKDIKLLELAVMSRIDEAGKVNEQSEAMLWELRAFQYGPKRVFEFAALLKDCENLFRSY